MSTERNDRRTLIGVVVSKSMTKTISVEVERTFRHAKYGKFVRRKKKHMAHDEQEAAQLGDRVEIAATRPISKRKRWRLVNVVERARMPEALESTEETVAALLEGGES